MRKIMLVLVFLLACSMVYATGITLNQCGPAIDMSNQYKYQYDYSKGTVTLNYESVDDKYFKGTLTATSLKPGFTYQLKMWGKPTCKYSDGNDIINERIGYKGRWSCADCACTGSACNLNDADYVANKAKLDSDPTKKCIQGYLVFDYFTTDVSGNAVLNFQSDNSYHVLYCNGGLCNSGSNAYLSSGLCAADKVGGQLERGSCDGTYLKPGNYDVVVGITEESFHQGNWATVLLNDNVEFDITDGNSGGDNGSNGGDGGNGGGGYNYFSVAELNVGDSSSEEGSTLNGWSNNQTGVPFSGNNYGGGDDGTFRLILGPGDGCLDINRDATFTLDAGSNTVSQLTLVHLDGSQDDSFDVYIKDGENYTKIGSYSWKGYEGEVWMTSSYPFSPRSGVVEFKIVATGNINQLFCPQYGQLAFSLARIEQEQSPIPEFSAVAAGIALVGAGAGFIFLRRRR
jgi:hypothetical protein